MSSYRSYFPILETGPDRVYLDSAATSHKPLSVLEAMNNFYLHHNGNTHRGVHSTTEAATADYEAARGTIANFIGAPSPESVVITHGATSGLNIAAYSFGQAFLKPGDLALSSVLDHHSSFLPLQRAAKQAGADFDAIPITERGELDLDRLAKFLDTGRVRVISLPHASNVLGTVLPIAQIVQMAHQKGAYVIVDGSQIVSHRPVNVTQLGVDAYAFSSHKIYGPTGCGALYINPQLVNQLEPFELGGGMVGKVGLNQTTFAPAPYRFEAGTPPIAEAVGLAEAIRFVQKIGFAQIMSHENTLAGYAQKRLAMIEGLTLFPSSSDKVGVFAFNLEGIHPHDVGTILDMRSVAVRVGHHCAQPLMQALGILACVRASLAIYNDSSDIDALADALIFAQSKLYHV